MRNSLKNILTAYSVYDKETGYCQGMGFIVANLLFHLNPKLYHNIKSNKKKTN